jgi:hypothetical protein
MKFRHIAALAIALLLSACSTTSPTRVALVGNGPDDMCHPANPVGWVFYPVAFPICVIQASEAQPGGIATGGVSGGNASGGNVPSNNGGQEMDLKQGLGWTQIVPEGGNDYWVHQTVPDGN